MDLLLNKIEDWSKQKGLHKADPFKQILKVYEESAEIAASMARNDLEGIKDGIGDTLVTIIILAQQYGWTLEECGYQAYNEIKGRTGKMVNGVFVKSEDLK